LQIFLFYGIINQKVVKRGDFMAIYESGENYLETILVLQTKNVKVRAVDVANQLGYSKASISRAMSILKNAGYIEIEESGNILLTDSGKQKANEILERHKIITEFLVRSLNVDFDIADKDACRIEHIVSEEIFRKMREFVEGDI